MPSKKRVSRHRQPTYQGQYSATVAAAVAGKSLVEASQAANFESQLRESQAEDSIRQQHRIVAPAEGSEEATAASLEAADEAADEVFDGYPEDNLDGIDWARLPRYMKPLTSQRQKRNRIYGYGYRVELLNNPSRICFVCQLLYTKAFSAVRSKTARLESLGRLLTSSPALIPSVSGLRGGGLTR
jgi:hypothetical protein